MSRYPKFARKQSPQDGYALILVVFLTTMLLISIMGISLSIRTENQREKEQEMIWRGKQYVRGIKMYYRKTGRFPTTIEDLTKPKIGSLRFMRKAYTDPMNKQDGSWRLIYVGPAGQLIGSLKPQQTFQLPGVAGATPAAAVGQQANSSAFGQSAFGSTFGQSGTQAGSQPGTQAATQNGNAQAGATNAGQGTDSADDGSGLPASASDSTSPIIGGNIIGVGSKVNKRSVIVYDKAKNLRLFEFVWNPSKDLQNALGQAVAPVATPGTGAPGTVAPTSPAPTGTGVPQPTPDQQQPPQP